jgi:hypothetical protein
MKVTKKEKIEKYDSLVRLVREKDLLTRYFWETQKGTMADKVVSRCEMDRQDRLKLTVQLFKIDAAYGGFVVLQWNTNGALAHYLRWADDWLDTPARYGTVSDDIEEHLKEELRMFRSEFFEAAITNSLVKAE